MCLSLSGVAPMIIWVDCPAGAKRGAWRYLASSPRLSRMPSRIWAMGARMAPFSLSGHRRLRLSSLGSSMLTLSRSASSPSRRVRRGSAPGMALAWM